MTPALRCWLRAADSQWPLAAITIARRFEGRHPESNEEAVRWHRRAVRNMRRLQELGYVERVWLREPGDSGWAYEITEAGRRETAA